MDMFNSIYVKILYTIKPFILIRSYAERNIKIKIITRKQSQFLDIVIKDFDSFNKAVLVLSLSLEILPD